MTKTSLILDANGKPFPTVTRERQLAMWQERFLRLKAAYDAARTTDEFKNYWGNADHLDADSANSYSVRRTLVSRSRYEVGNNAYADGISQTITNDLIGVGPSLRMQTASAGFNQMVELQWYLWCKSIDFPRKLWAMGHAKHVDGESFAIVVRNPAVRHAIQLDLQLRETDQCHTPFLAFNDPTTIDGVKLDHFGNPVFYEFLKAHPGSEHQTLTYQDTDMFPADSVLHWFRLRRPGQHRGVPEMVSSLNAGAAARRWREATLSAAERAALLTLMMKTQMTADEADEVAPFSTMDIEKGLMSFLPAGWEMQQAEGKFPTATHEAFHKALVNEMGRSVNMPRNKAAADSSDYNYASGRLDHGTYYDSLDVQRGDCDAQVLDKLFRRWFDLAVVRFGWLGGDPTAIGEGARIHLWDWPKHRVADVEAEANATDTKLKSGQTSIPRVYSECGLDAEDEAETEAKYFGLTLAELKQRKLDVLYPPVQQGGAPSQTADIDDAVASALYTMNRRGMLPAANGNGHAHHG